MKHITVATCLSLGWLALALMLAGCNVAATGHNIEGKRLYEQGRFAEALASFQRAMQNNPRSADAYYNMAATYHFLGKQNRNSQWTQQADQLYRNALALDDRLVDAYRGLAVLLIENGQSQSAFDLLRGWQMQQPESAEPRIELARLYREYGDRDRAIQYMADALAVDAQNARALKAMGQLREEQGQYQLALDNYIRSYQVNNLQADVAARIASLQGTVPAPSTKPQPGQTRLGSAQHYVPR